MTDSASNTLTVLEKENADRFDCQVYSPTVLKLLHKLEDGFVDLIPLPLREIMTTRGRKNSGSKHT